MGAEAKDKAAFAAIYKENFEIVYRVAMKYSENHHAAEEIAQNVFLKLYLNIEHINVDAARAWLIMTAKNMALNLKRDRAKEYLVEEFNEEGERILADMDTDPEEVFLRMVKEQGLVELKEDIFAALYAKNSRWYDAITISYVLEKPQKEVADNMGVSLKVLHSMLYRARQWIADNYREKYEHLREE